MAETDSSKHPPRASKRARAAFNWPPTDQDLAELGILFPDSEPEPAGETADPNSRGAARSKATEPIEGEAITADTAAIPETVTGESTPAKSRAARTSRKRRKKHTTESSASPFEADAEEAEQGVPRRARGGSTSRLEPVPPGTGGPFNWPPTDEELAEFTKPFEPLTPEIIAARQRAEALRGPRDIWGDENDDARDASDIEAPGAQSGPVRPRQKRQVSRSTLTLGRLLAAAVIAYAVIGLWWRWELVPQVPSSSTNRPVESTPARAPRSADAPSAVQTPPSESAAAPAPRPADAPSSVTTAPAEVPLRTPAVAANRPAEPSAPVARPSDAKTRAAAPPTPTTARAPTTSTARGPERATPSSVTAPPAAVSEAPASVEPSPVEVARTVEPPPPAEPAVIAREPETRAPLAPATPAPTTAPAATLVPASPVPVPAVALVDDRSAIQRVLARYEYAYDQLDARAAVAVWPSVDARALERAFARLQNQDLEFHQCDVDVQPSGAMAECSGELHYVRRVGSVAPRAEPHTWTIQLERFGEGWRIARVTGR